MNRLLALLLLLVGLETVWAAPPAIFKMTVDADLDTAFETVHKALENEKFWVVFEADMGARMMRFKDKWGDDYNRNDLTAVKSMVFCHIGWTNQIANADPDLLAICPLHLSLYEKDGKTSLVLPRPSAIAAGSPGQAKAAELEKDLTTLLEGAFK